MNIQYVFYIFQNNDANENNAQVFSVGKKCLSPTRVATLGNVEVHIPHSRVGNCILDQKKLSKVSWQHKYI